MHQPRDSTFKQYLDKIKPQPIFIIGLHRSGTTYLYRAIVDNFHIAYLTVYHVFYYDNILYYHYNKTDTSFKQGLERVFQNWDMTTRGIDNVPLSHSLPEEYGWLLKSRLGIWNTNHKNAPLVDDICRKLHVLMPTATNVMLKNPFDTGHVGQLHEKFPDAKFIFLTRNPLAIVNSQFRVARYLGENKNPFINKLFSQIPLGGVWLWIQRAVRKSAGQFIHSRLALNYIIRSVIRELVLFETSWALVPAQLRLAIEYEEMVNNHEVILKQVSSFLGYSRTGVAIQNNTNVRQLEFFPEVAAIKNRFYRVLRERGIAHNNFTKIK